MFPKSIKWRLQLWYGLILVLVLTGFGFTAYQLERGRLLGRIDGELRRRVEILAGALRRPPPHGPEANGPHFDRPPPGQFLGGGPPGQNPHSPREFHLPPEAAHLFDGSDPNNFYFFIQRDGEELARSANVPPNPNVIIDTKRGFERINNLAPQFPGGPAEFPRPAKVVDLDNYRVTADVLPSGEMIWVGCSIAPELKELHRTALKLTGIGGVILFFGLAGGWWIVSRSLRPIVAISSAAVKISAGDLSQRINVAEAESELGQLATVLNSTFARLESAFAQQKQFAADAAHELRTPVSVMLTQTQTALNRERDTEAYKQTIEACQRAAQRMRKLIESLLALARFDAGQEVLERLSFDVSKAIAECTELVRPMAAECGVKIISDLPLMEITGDAGRLAQVITNLLTNAIQYNHPEGEVRVTLESRNGLAMLTVTDTGQGIAPADLPLVFGRFFRADQSRTGAGNAGLGLAISKAIVEAHGGTIEVTSEQNIGTTFTVRLPV
jgi:two-component system, OmpR family, sensor kinase